MDEQTGRAVFLGVEGSGKTMLTIALAKMFSEHEDLGWSMQPENREAFAFLERMSKYLPQNGTMGEVPAQTARFRHLKWMICYNDEPQRALDIVDYPGEVYRLAFLDPEEDASSERLRTVQNAYSAEIAEFLGLVKSAEQVFVLFNLDDAEDLSENDRNVDAVWVTVQALKCLTRMKNGPEVLFLITQADRLKAGEGAFSTPEEVVRKHLPLVGRQFKDIPKFLVSSKEYNHPDYGVKPILTRLFEHSKIGKRTREMISGSTSFEQFDQAVEELAEIKSAFMFLSSDVETLLEDIEVIRNIWYSGLADEEQLGRLKDCFENLRTERGKAYCAEVIEKIDFDRDVEMIDEIVNSKRSFRDGRLQKLNALVLYTVGGRNYREKQAKRLKARIFCSYLLIEYCGICSFALLRRDRETYEDFRTKQNRVCQLISEGRDPVTSKVLNNSSEFVRQNIQISNYIRNSRLEAIYKNAFAPEYYKRNKKVVDKVVVELCHGKVLASDGYDPSKPYLSAPNETLAILPFTRRPWEVDAEGLLYEVRRRQADYDQKAQGIKDYAMRRGSIHDGPNTTRDFEGKVVNEPSMLFVMPGGASYDSMEAYVDDRLTELQKRREADIGKLLASPAADALIRRNRDTLFSQLKKLEGYDPVLSYEEMAALPDEERPVAFDVLKRNWDSWGPVGQLDLSGDDEATFVPWMLEDLRNPNQNTQQEQ